MLLSNSAARRHRHDFNRTRVLRFLSVEKWSTREVLAALLRLAYPQNAHRLLARMEHDGLVCRHSIEGVTVWGITARGLAQVEGADGVEFKMRMVGQQMEHRLALQRMRVRAEHAGWTQWRYPPRGFGEKDDAIPDAVARDPRGSLIAIEVERSLKSVEQFAQMVFARVGAAKAEDWDAVLFVCDTEALARTLARRMPALKNKHGDTLGSEVIARFRFETFDYDFRLPVRAECDSREIADVARLLNGAAP